MKTMITLLSYFSEHSRFSVLALMGLGLLVGPLQAQPLTQQQLGEIGIDQRLGEDLPLELVFNDESGKSVALREYFGMQPVILALVYYECPMLCTQVLNGLMQSLRILSFEAGREFQVLAVSIDPGEGPALAAAKKQEYTRQYNREGTAKGWHFLTGTQDQIDRLAEAVGFRYQYDEETDQYIHAAGVMVLTPEGQLARYFYGIEFPPRDLRLGLVEAAANQIGSPVDQLLLLCYQYDPATGKYGLVILNSLRIAGLLTVVVLGTFIVVMLRRERSKKMSAVGV